MLSALQSRDSNFALKVAIDLEWRSRILNRDSKYLLVLYTY